MEKNCIFCQIANGQTDTEILYQTDTLVVFKDINPHAPVHLLFVPKKHIRSINDLTDAPTLAHLLKYDSVHGRFNGTVEVDGSDLIINGDRLKITAERDPAHLDWSGVDVVIESTGIFRAKEQINNHLPLADL